MGLSIVEWKPVAGIIPPLSHNQWEQEFAKYQHIPQYRTMNFGMGLSDFKRIYWWEWSHRLLGRVIAVLFVVPFLWFSFKGYIDGRLRRQLWVILGLGALQGAVGWWMVASGLADRTEVSQYRLATHLTLACMIFAATLWAAQTLGARPGRAVRRATRTIAMVLVGLVFVQLYLGGLLAGLRGGYVYNTWPLMNGSLLPPWPELFALTPGWRNLFENRTTVQLSHRLGAYVLWLLGCWIVVDVVRSGAWFALWGALSLLGAITLQATLGILTLVYQVPLYLALAHQLTAMVVLALAVVHAHRVTRTFAAVNASC